MVGVEHVELAQATGPGGFPGYPVSQRFNSSPHIIGQDLYYSDSNSQMYRVHVGIMGHMGIMRLFMWKISS